MNRLLGMALAGLCAAVAVPPVHAANLAKLDIAAFCRVHPTDDDPGQTHFAPRYDAGTLPDQVRETGATNWRCMGGHAWLCLDSADGAACSPKDPSRTPSRAIHDTCADQPGLDYVDRAAMGASASAWRCDGRTPLIIHTVPLDARGFMVGPWQRYVVRDGAVIAPRLDDFQTDPR